MVHTWCCFEKRFIRRARRALEDGLTHTLREVGWIDAGYFSVGSNAINESITPSALVCHFSHTKWLLDSKLVAPWAAVNSSAP
jgi:hypothetical protein